MPNPKDFQDKQSFLTVCIPMMIKDKNMENDQAVAACSNMWEHRDKATSNARSHLIANAYREVKTGDKIFLVVPGVPLREQVMNSYLVPAEEIARSVPGWNGTAVSINHPTKNNGSVNVPDPDVAIIGRFYNARWEPSQARMIGEYWIDVEEAMKWKEGETIVANVKDGKVLETSTGYYADEEIDPGKFKGRAYETIHRNLLSDHIAILPKEIGACSIKDGCGVNRNVAFHNCACDCPFKNEESLEDQLDEVRSAFEKEFLRTSEVAVPTSYPWVRKTYDDYLVVEDGGELYRVNFGKDPDGNLTFASREQWKKVELLEQYVEINAAVPDYQEGHLPQAMLVGYCFNKGNRTPEQLASLRAYIQDNGIDKQVTIMRMDDGEIKILDGNHRVSMAGEFGIDQIPVKVINEQLQEIDPELMYKEWAHGQDQGYLNAGTRFAKQIGQRTDRESRSSTSTTVQTNQKEPSMKVKVPEFLSFLKGKGIQVSQNAEGEFEVEEPTTPAATADPGANGLSADDIAALKSLASLAPTLNALSAGDLPAQLQVVTNFAKSIEEKDKVEREQLVASIKANAANVYSDEELAALPSSMLVKLNAQMNMSYVGLGGPQLVQNADDAPLAIPPVLLVEEVE